MESREISLEAVKDVAVRAGVAVLEVYRRQAAWVRRKADGSPVTEADIASEQVIRAGLSSIDPSIPYLSEESTLSSYVSRREWQRFWLVDPLDGTKEFLKRTDEFTVNIALIEKGQPVLGVIVAPAVGSIYYASKYEGAWKDHTSAEPKRLSSQLADVDRPLRVIESVSHPSPELEHFLEGFEVADRLRIGSSLKFCLLAEGVADVYPRLGPTMEWDTVAAHAVLKAAGGEINKYGTNESLKYNKQNLLNAEFIAGHVGAIRSLELMN